MAFDLSGKQLAMGGQGSGKVQVRDIASGELVREFDKGEKKVRQLGYTRDGKFLVTVGSDSPYMWASQPIADHLNVWNATTGEHVLQSDFTAASTESILVLPDGRQVVLGASYSPEGNAIQVLSLESGTQRALLHGHEAAVNSLAYAGSGIIASGCRDKTIRLWDTSTWKSIAIFEGHEDEIKCIAFSPDKEWLASCDDGGSIRLWDAKTQKQVYEFPKQEYACHCLCFSPDGKRLVTGHENGTALVWDVAAMLP